MDSSGARLDDCAFCDDPLATPSPLDATTLTRLCEKYGAHFTEDTIRNACRERFTTDKRVTGPSYSPTYKKSPHHTTCPVGIAVLVEHRSHKRHKSARMQTASHTTRTRLSVTFFTTQTGTKDKKRKAQNERVHATFLRQCMLATAAAIPTLFEETFNVPEDSFCGKLITKQKPDSRVTYRHAWLILAVFDLFVLHPPLESICKYCVTITSARPLRITSTESVSSRRTQIVVLLEHILIGIDIVHDVMEVHA